MCQSIKEDEAKATPEQPAGFAPIKVKGLRADIQDFINFINSYNVDSREVNIAVQNLEEAKMWLGKYLGTLPEGGEDLNAERDAGELKDAYPETGDTPEPETPAPAKGQDQPAEEATPAEEAAPAEGQDTPEAPAEEEVAPPQA